MNAYEFIIKMKNYASSELRKVAREIGVTDNKSKLFTNNLKKNEAASKSLSSALSGLKGKLVGLFAGVSLMAFTNQVIDARKEYEKFDAVLTNTFQSKEIGQGALAMLTDFAAKTPYQLNELTGGFIKLVNRGINPTYDEMTKMGDLASSQGKSFDQLVEAIMDAQTGEFERMKEFGIRASKSGDKVAFTFKGITKEVAMNDQAIKDAIISYGAMTGVAGSMEVISQTLGGRISNLEDQWWSFLVAVGGYGGGIIGDFLDMANQGLAFLQAHLPQIAWWFEVLWQNISPLVDSAKEFIKAALGFSGAGDALQTFGNIMTGVLMVVDWFSSGLSYMIDNLRPIAPELAVITAAVWLFNIAMAMTPIGWVILGIIALSTSIGMLMKYTDGWGKSWTALGNLIKLWWQQVKSDFRMGVDIAIYQFNRLRYSAFEIFDKIGQKIANVGKAIQQGLDFDFSGAYNTLNKEVTSVYTKKLEENEKQYEKKLKKYNTDTKSRINSAAKEIGNIGITVDTEGISNDFNKLKKSFSALTSPKTGDVSMYEDFLNKDGKITAPGMNNSSTGGAKKEQKKESDGIVSGGSKQTNITLNIGKLNEKIEVITHNLKEGAGEIEEKMQEILLRALNSVNQMQTT